MTALPEVMDQDIAEALRSVPNLAWLTIKQVREEEWVNVLAHAQTLAKLRVAREALEKISEHNSKDIYALLVAEIALTQIKGTDHDHA